MKYLLSFFAIISLLQSTCGFTPVKTHTRLPSISRLSAGRAEVSMRWGLKGNNPLPNTTPDGVPLRDTVPFEIRGFSLPLVGNAIYIFIYFMYI